MGPTAVIFSKIPQQSTYVGACSKRNQSAAAGSSNYICSRKFGVMEGVPKMRIMTIVKGQVQADRREAFEVAYRSVRGESLPPGLEMSFSVRGTDDSGTYMIVTVWSSRDALDMMRANTKPRAVSLFEEVGVSPKVEIHEIVGSVP